MNILESLLAPHTQPRVEALCRGIVSSLAVQIAAIPEIRRMVCEFADREKYPERPMLTLNEKNPSVYLLGWREGDFTDIHDHGACEVGVAVITGMVVEDLYATMPLGTKGNRHVILETSRFLGQGQLISCPKNYLHRIGNVFPEVAATLHVYGPVLSEMRLYKAVGDVLELTGCWGCDANPQH